MFKNPLRKIPSKGLFAPRLSRIQEMEARNTEYRKRFYWNDYPVGHPWERNNEVNK